MKCANCGKEIKPDARFCPYCGIPLIETGIQNFSDNNTGSAEEEPMTYVGTSEETYFDHAGSDDKTYAEFRHSQTSGGGSDSSAGYPYEYGREVDSRRIYTSSEDSEFTKMDRSGFDQRRERKYPVNDPKLTQIGSGMDGIHTSFDATSSERKNLSAEQNFQNDLYTDRSGIYEIRSEGSYRTNGSPSDGITKKNYKRIALITLAIVAALGVTAFGTVYHQQKVRDQERASRVIRMIDRLGEPNAVTLDDRTEVDTARKTFDQLTDRQKEQVDNDVSLFSAESIIDQLEKEQEQGELTEDDLNRQQEIFEQQQDEVSRQYADNSEFEDEPYYYVMSHPVSWGAYRVTTNTEPLTLRSGPSYHYKRLAKIPKDSIVYVYGLYNGWYYVDYNGQWGWSNAKYLTSVDSEPLIPVISESTSGYKMVESNPSYMGEYVVNTKKLHLRSGPGTGYASRAVMSKDEKVSAYGSYDGWYYIDYKGTMGWTNGKTKYLKPTSSQDSSDSEFSTEIDRIESYPTLQGTFKIDANELNIRTGPGTGYKKLKTLHRDDKVNGYDIYNGWRYVEYKDTWGWMKNQYLNAVVQNAGEETEITQLIPPPEYEDLGEFTVSTKETNLPLRYGPEKSADKICEMPKGSMVIAHGYLDGWYYVEFNGKEGWAGEDYLTKNSKIEDKEDKEVKETMVKPSNKDYIADYTVDSALKLYYGPGTEYGEVGSLPKDATVSAYGSENGWYYVYNKEKDVKGWADGSNLHIKETTAQQDTELSAATNETMGLQDEGENTFDENAEEFENE